MRNGNIVEQGAHDQLMAQNGFYTNLYNSQFDPETD
jgi:ATP-binding cassette subfamily B protein